MILNSIHNRISQKLSLSIQYSFDRFNNVFISKDILTNLSSVDSFRNFALHRASLESTGMSDRLENVTQTISRILDGYDIRLRPNFGGEFFGRTSHVLLKFISNLSFFYKFTAIYTSFNFDKNYFACSH